MNFNPKSFALHLRYFPRKIQRVGRWTPLSCSGL